MPSSRAHGGPVCATALALLVLALAWGGLVEDLGPGHLTVLCLLAAAPAVAGLSPRAPGALALAAAVLAVPTALAVALRRPAGDLLGLQGEAWTAARRILPEGLRQGGDAGLPVTLAERPELVALIDMALVALAATAAWQILVRRRPVAGLLAVGVGLAYRWTVEPPGNGVVAGGLALAALAAVLALASWDGGGIDRAFRRIGGAVVIGAAAVALAAGLGTGPARAGDAWWGWQDWELGNQRSAGASLELAQSYGALDWSDEPRVALTVEAPRSMPLRAVGLDEFDGVAFALAGGGGGASESLPVADGVIRTAGVSPASGRRAVQRVTLADASSQLVLASGRPQAIRGSFRAASLIRGDGIRSDRPLVPGSRYTVETVVPRTTPATLSAAAGYDPAVTPAEATRLRAGLWSEPLDVPLWGSGGPEPADAALGPYAPVRGLARTVAGDAPTVYAAVNRIESYLRRSYVYDEAPPFPTSLPEGARGGWPPDRPPLVDFLLVSRRGFCQHFAGGMTVMLRSLGIPSRVAVGYTGGRYDTEEDRYEVLDRDAHTWVEVWFPGRGWVPFDPTPGRSVPNAASVSSADYAPTALDIDRGGLAEAAVDPTPENRPVPAPEESPAPEADAAPAAPAASGTPLWQAVLAGLALALVLALLAAPLARAAGRLRRRLGGDERTRVRGAVRDLELSLARLGWAPDPSASATERARALRERTGVDASRLYRAAAIARFAPGPPRAGAGASAWSEARRVRRAVARRTAPRRRLAAALGFGGGGRGTLPGWRARPRHTTPTVTASGS